MKGHWQYLFNMPTSAQDSTLDEVRQRPERAEVGDKPDEKEIIGFTRKAKSKSSTTYQPNFGKRLWDQTRTFSLKRGNSH